MNHNHILGIANGASAEEIQLAFRKKALEHHPDQNPSPEAAEAFIRIKEARDSLMQEAALTPHEDAQSIQRATDVAMRATAAATYTQQTTQTTSTVDDMYAGMTPDEIVYIQKLDRLAMQKPKRRFMQKRHESPEVVRHRKGIETRSDRLEGKY